MPERVRLVWLSAPYFSDFSSEDQAKIASFNYPPARFLMTKEQYEELNQSTDSRFSHPHPLPPRVYGPFEFEVRSKIPRAVLRKVKGNWEYGLGVTIEFTESYQRMNWALRKLVPPPPGTPNNPLCVGGEIDAAPGQKVLKWKNGTTEMSAPIWPHCKI